MHRYFVYFIIVGALTIIYLGMLLFLIANRRLLPSIVIIGSFMFFVLWLVGLIFVGMELWAPSGSVASNCDLLVFFPNQAPGNNQANLAWLMQKSICELSLFYGY
jgi:disulfide bond formation protein DsbB